MAIATGTRAHTLKEMRDALSVVHPGCIHHHFWGGLLRPSFDDPEYHNDFALWARRFLHDGVVAERLAVIHPEDFTDVEDLRLELIDVLEERLFESEWTHWARSEQEFHFVRSLIVVFDTHQEIMRPEELTQVIRHMSVSSIFYHFVDARRRTPRGTDDFRAWLEWFDGRYQKLVEQLAAIDPYFLNLSELRQALMETARDYFGESS